MEDWKCGDSDVGCVGSEMRMRSSSVVLRYLRESCEVRTRFAGWGGGSGGRLEVEAMVEERGRTVMVTRRKAGVSMLCAGGCKVGNDGRTFALVAVSGAGGLRRVGSSRG